jgi:hypothetical protein
MVHFYSAVVYYFSLYPSTYSQLTYEEKRSLQPSAFHSSPSLAHQILLSEWPAMRQRRAIKLKHREEIVHNVRSRDTRYIRYDSRKKEKASA